MAKDHQLIVDVEYIPEPKQEVFHTSNAKFRLYIGAWRSGKTWAGCQEALKQSILYNNNRGLIGRKDFSDLRDTTIRTFFEICPKRLIKSYNKTEHHLVLINGSEILFRELKDETGLGSLNLGWWYIDEAEECTETVFERLKGRLSLNSVGRNCGWLTSNPPNTDHWIYKQFEENKDGQDYTTFHANTYENKEYLPEGYIASLEKLPPSWKKKYLEGQYGFTPDGKPFYENFKEYLHKKEIVKYDKKLPIIRSWDFGFHHPFCSYHQIDKHGRWLVLKELMGNDITINEFGTFVGVKSREWFPEVTNFQDYGDPAGWQVNDKSEMASVEILATKGIFIGSRPSTFRERKEIIERKLATLIDGLPAFMVDASCHLIIDGFLGGYHYPVRGQKQSFNPKLFEVPFKDGYYEHGMNTVEYFAVNHFTGAESNEEEDINDVSYKVVGPMKDIRFYGDEYDEGGKYRLWQKREPTAIRK